MVKTVRRRAADPSIVLQLWEAITCIRQSKQVANVERIFRFVERSYGITSKECQRHLGLAVKDNLLVKELSRAKKGSNAGRTQDGFWCAEERTDESEEPHDWYCFACHKGGDVLCCGTCHRVYHPECVKVDDPEKIFGLWICPICESCRKKSMQISKWDLNKILLHVVNRMKEKARDLTKKLNLDELPNYYNLVYQHMDLAVISQRLNEKKYRSLEEFQGDAQALIHVAAVYHGGEGEKTKLSEEVVKDCLHDISEIRLCKDCYIMSNDRTQKDWFCKPCHPPHELVWAQMVGFGYWPAKVLQRNQEKVDVRFFGNRHERAWIEISYIRDINIDRKKLKLKQSTGWRKAVSEMEKYQKNLEKIENDHQLSTSTSSSASLTTAMRRKMKRKAPKREKDEEEEMEREDASSVLDDAGGEGVDGEVNEDEEEEAKGEAKHVVRSSSTTDAGQDQSVSTSQISLESADEPPIKKLKAAPATPSLPQATEVEPEMEPNTEDTQDTPPPPSLEEVKEEEKEEEMEEEREEEEMKEEREEMKEEREQEEKEKEEEEKVEKEKEEKKKVKVKKVLASKISPNLEADYKKKLDKAVKEALEKAKQEWQSEKEKLVKEAREKLEAEKEKTKAEVEERCKKEYNEQIQKLRDEISQTKKKQWCINCEKEAMYHCCWNTSYCSINCQQVHWHQEHKRLCRRKR